MGFTMQILRAIPWILDTLDLIFQRMIKKIKTIEQPVDTTHKN